MHALTWNTALQILIAIVAFVMVLGSVRIASRYSDLISKIWKRVRIRMFVESLLLLVVTIIVAMTIRNQWEFSHISWTRLLVSDGGSVFKAPMTLARESGRWWAMLFPIVLFSLGPGGNLLNGPEFDLPFRVRKFHGYQSCLVSHTRSPRWC